MGTMMMMRGRFSKIPEIREYVRLLDEKFPYWLFFLTKNGLGLQAITFCMMSPYLTEQARREILPQQLAQLLSNRWFPAMNHMCIATGFSKEGARLRPMAQFLGTRCHCGQVAVTHRTTHSYRQVGRLSEREAGLLLPRADRSPVPPLCVHHMLSFLEQRLGKGIKTRARARAQAVWIGRVTPANAAVAHAMAPNPTALPAPRQQCVVQIIARRISQDGLTATACNRGCTASAAR